MIIFLGAQSWRLKTGNRRRGFADSIGCRDILVLKTAVAPVVGRT